MSILSLLLKSDPNEPSSEAKTDCALCNGDGGQVLWKGAYWRLVAVDDPAYPGYVRLIANRHVTELTWLAKPEQDQLFKLITAIEKHLQVHLKPHKINQASLGNQTPHLHWHIIPRWNDDPCFPDSIWSAKRNPEPSPELEARKAAAQAAFEGLGVLCRKTVY
jgi:diadenosine tetraphosphate (Ap4A) HIT family hydrolase